MSSKSRFKLPKSPSIPRTIEVLQQEAQKAMGELAQLTYQRFLYRERAQELNNLIKSLNQEAAARNELDKAKEAAKPVTVELVAEGASIENA